MSGTSTLYVQDQYMHPAASCVAEQLASWVSTSNSKIINFFLVMLCILSYVVIMHNILINSMLDLTNKTSTNMAKILQQYH